MGDRRTSQIENLDIETILTNLIRRHRKNISTKLQIYTWSTEKFYDINISALKRVFKKKNISYHWWSTSINERHHELCTSLLTTYRLENIDNANHKQLLRWLRWSNHIDRQCNLLQLVLPEKINRRSKDKRNILPNIVA